MISGVYEDYENECLKLFNSITEIFLKGDYNGNSFVFPKHIIYMNRDWLERHEDSYSNVWQEAISRDSPYLINLCSDWQRKEINVQFSNNTYYNFGTLQNISLNLPRYAYISKNETDFIKIIRDMMNLCSRIFVKKYDIIEKRLNSKHLPLCSSYIKNREPLFKLENQNLAFNFVGLNEAVKYLINQELHENIDAFNFGKKIIKEIKNVCEELTRKTGKKHILQENISNRAAYRFAKLDLKHFAKIAIPQTFNGIRCYTNSAQFKENLIMDSDEKINKQSVFHEILQNGHNFYNFSLKDVQTNAQNLHKMMLDICTTSQLACIKFSQ
jgi:ribonucleoside-triphosphate reductase